MIMNSRKKSFLENFSKARGQNKKMLEKIEETSAAISAPKKRLKDW